MNINRALFLDALKTAGRCVARKSTYPSVTHINLNCETDMLRVRATNFMASASVPVPTSGPSITPISLPASTLTDWVSRVSGDTINVTVDASTMTASLSVDRAKASIKGLSNQDFPLVADALEPDTSIASDLLKQAASIVTYAAASDESRPILQGVLLKVSDGKVTLAAADGYRLAVTSYNTEAIEPRKVIVPSSSLDELSRMLDGQPVGVQFTDNQVVFGLEDGTVFTTQLIDGNYPDYNQIIPDTHETETAVSRAQLQNAVATARIFAREASNIAVLTMSDGTLTVSAKSAETGDHKATMEAVVNGQDIEIAVNAQYLADTLRAIPTEDVIIRSSAPSRPLTFLPSEVEDVDGVHVVMPMHLGR